jgi:fatty acyl-CoA reductase
VNLASILTKDRCWLSTGQFRARIYQLLPRHLVKTLEASNKIVVLSGDITCPNSGLEETALATLRDSVSIFIHIASSVNLRHDISKLTASVIHPSLSASRLALNFKRLERFVHVSTAYVNAVLHFRKQDTTQFADCVVEKTIYPLRSDSSDDNVLAELRNLNEFGTRPEYTCLPHPFPCSYAKHLTERLLLHEFRAAGREQLDRRHSLRLSTSQYRISKLPAPRLVRLCSVLS